MHGIALAAGQKALVLKEFQIDTNGPRYVHISARRAGLTAFLLTAMGIDVTTSLDVYNNRVEFLQGSLSGNIQTTMPMSSLSIATTGYTKPILSFVLGILGLLAGVILMIVGAASHNAAPAIGIGILLLVIGLIFIIKYYLNKTLLISVVSNSSWSADICFKRSVIEGVKVDYAQAQAVFQIINQLLLAQTAK